MRISEHLLRGDCFGSRLPAVSENLCAQTQAARDRVRLFIGSGQAGSLPEHY